MIHADVCLYNMRELAHQEKKKSAQFLLKFVRQVSEQSAEEETEML